MRIIRIAITIISVVLVTFIGACLFISYTFYSSHQIAQRKVLSRITDVDFPELRMDDWVLAENGVDNCWYKMGIKAFIYERIFKKKYLDKQKRRCNENIKSWLEAMVYHNSKYVGESSVKEAIDYANKLIALADKNELEQIAMIHSLHSEKLGPIYGEQAFIIFEPLLDELYRYYPEYKPKDRTEFSW